MVTSLTAQTLAGAFPVLRASRPTANVVWNPVQFFTDTPSLAKLTKRIAGAIHFPAKALSFLDVITPALRLLDESDLTGLPAAGVRKSGDCGRILQVVPSVSARRLLARARIATRRMDVFIGAKLIRQYARVSPRRVSGRLPESG